MLPLLLRMMPLLIQVEIVLIKIITIISMTHTTINIMNIFITIHYVSSQLCPPGALDAAAAAGEDAGVCEVIMFDRGEGTYSLKFVQNAC